MVEHSGKLAITTDERAEQIALTIQVWAKRLDNVTETEGDEILAGIKKALNIRNNSSIARTRNIGIGDFEATINRDNPTASISIKGENLLGISAGNPNVSDALPIPSDRLLPVLVDKRSTDSEVLILEEIATKIADAYANAGLQTVREEIIGQDGIRHGEYNVFQEVTGTITIFSERKPCESCSPLIRDIWKKIFPNVKIEKVLHGPRYRTHLASL